MLVVVVVVTKEMRMHSFVVLYVDDEICMNCTSCQPLLHSGQAFPKAWGTAGVNFRLPSL